MNEQVNTQWKVYTDEGAGVTAESLDVWNSCKGKLGQIYHIIVEGPQAYAQGRLFCMEIFAEHGIVLLSGTNCGYGGTGPNGTSKIFDDLGIPCEEKIFESDPVIWTENQSQMKVYW